MRLLLIALCTFAGSLAAYQNPPAPPTGTMELLWPNGAPGALGNDENLDKPKIYINLPSHPNGAAVVVFPGGGYVHLSTDKEGGKVAGWLNSNGVAAFVVTYRLGPRYHHPAMLEDAARAVRTVRYRAREFKIDPNRIGVIGFSAGGHMAATISTHFDKGDPNAQDPIDRVSSRPDFAILAYPVISMRVGIAHMGSRTNLLGENPPKSLVWLMSDELQVTPDTPPTFLFQTDNDPVVPVENSALYYLALKRAGVPAEMHIYAEGNHGVGLAPSDPVLSTWTERLRDWLKVRHIIPAQ